MAKAHYLPKSDKERAVWLNNFSSKFATYCTSLGFLASDAASVNNDTAMFNYALNMAEAYTTAKEQRINFKNILRDGPVGQVIGPIPVAPVIGSAPAAVAAGIFPRIAQLVQRIKNTPAYTEAIGKDLGIIGAEQITDFTTMKPVLKLVLKGGHVEVQWTKGGADALHIESDKGTGTWQFMAVDAVPHYPDLTPITAPGVWKYRAMYLVNDQLVGQWSAVASISVG
jgi:hypothetical protein